MSTAADNGEGLDSLVSDAGPLLWSSVGYFPFFVLACAQIWRFRSQKYLRLRLMYSLLSLAMACRISWFVLRGIGDNYFFEAVLNRVALQSYFTGFYLYVLSWQTMFTPWDKSRLVTKGFMVVNAVLYTAMFATVAIAFLVLPLRSMLSDVNFMLICLVYVILALMLGVLGYRLRRKASRILAGYPANFRRRIAFKLTCATVISVICFCLRSAMFMYHPLTGHVHFPIIDDVLYPYAFYHIPELVPLITMMVMLAPRAVARKVKHSSSSSNQPSKRSGTVASGSGSGHDTTNAKARSGLNAPAEPHAALVTAAAERRLVHDAEAGTHQQYGAMAADDAVDIDLVDNVPEEEDDADSDSGGEEHMSAITAASSTVSDAPSSSTAAESRWRADQILVLDSDHIGFEDDRLTREHSSSTVSSFGELAASASTPSERTSLLPR